jgi:uncharacterized protein YjiS (DUF1127 family)
MSALHWTGPAIHPRAQGYAANIFGVIAEWHHRSESRRELAALSDLALRDIGLTRVDAVREAEKPFWRS